MQHSITFQHPERAERSLLPQFSGADGRVGYAPFVVRPAMLGATNRVLVILPTNTWQAYNFQDADGNGYGDTWYAGPPNRSSTFAHVHRARRAPRFYRYDLPFLHWLYWSGKSAEFISDSDFDTIANGDELARAYDLVVFEGHEEYVTPHEYDVVQRYRDLGGNLMFLSANNFFWKVEKAGPGAAQDPQVARRRQARGGADRRPVPRQRRRPAAGALHGAGRGGGAVALGRQAGSSTARRSGSSSAATGSRSTQRRRRHRRGRWCSPRSPTSSARASRRRCATTRRSAARRSSPPARSTSAARRPSGRSSSMLDNLWARLSQP